MDIIDPRIEEYAERFTTPHDPLLAELSEETARRALKEFLPLSAVDPDRISGVDEVVADAIAFKFITAPLTQAQRAELIRVPQSK